MSGDLEDFLRRAAQRRQAKAAAEQSNPPPSRRPPPQYSDSRSERVTYDYNESDEIPTAEIVEFTDDDGSSIAARMIRREDAKRAAADSKQDDDAEMRKSRGMLSRQKLTKATFTGNPVQDLIAAMQSPGGVQQAILLKEILDRPIDRW
ncbi:hypothetical protein K227x_22130 [Rubripirellula lacrimiformis]|uniref:Uncharacterized protein n=1 Tax=Rubripirellula lacrimiformis TaxID=1930273 RepID=A0A517N9Z7_9BACT|nr:hypothetical protein [Rubripirellula lacrimiformis]QDT03828.1 hypothetical protein K227x_22130 [Rubripirellula lacrimiformis]